MEDQVLLGHGSGGTMMKRIIDEVFFAAYAGEELHQGDDAATISPLKDIGKLTDFKRVSPGPQKSATDEVAEFSTFSTDWKLAFSTDSFVVTPHFFPGGDIGRLAVCGTVNDVSTSGAIPLYLSCGFVLEEGFPIADLKRICASMADAAQEAGVRIVTGDTKVVNRGHGDGVFINTSGVGLLPEGVYLSGSRCKPGDKVIVTGTLGDHGITIMSCRESLSFSADVQSDAAPLNHLIANALAVTTENGKTSGAIRCFRDPTRGGLASTLNELADQSQVDIEIDEESVPIRDSVRGACDMLGYDPLQVANEGKMVCVVSAEQADNVLDAIKSNKYGADAAIIGKVSDSREDRGPKVFVRNAFGGRRILDMLVGEQLPRIC